MHPCSTSRHRDEGNDKIDITRHGHCMVSRLKFDRVFSYCEVGKSPSMDKMAGCDVRGRVDDGTPVGRLFTYRVPTYAALAAAIPGAWRARLAALGESAGAHLSRSYWSRYRREAV